MIDRVAQFLGIIGMDTADVPVFNTEIAEDVYYLIQYGFKVIIALIMLWGIFKCVHWVVRLFGRGML